MGIREQLNSYSGRERQHFLKEEAMAKHIFKWENNLEREEAICGNSKNKLRTYQIFKFNYFNEKYLGEIINCRNCDGRNSETNP